MTNMFARAWGNKAYSHTVNTESHQIMGKPVPVTVEPTPVIETPVVERTHADNPGPVEVDLPAPIVIAETRHIDIDTEEVVAESKIVAIPKGPEVNATYSADLTYDQIVHDVNDTLRDLGDATSESAYTYGIEKLRKAKKDKPDDWIVGHIFGASYDLWISEYNESERIFF